ncbi:hypothetical protein Lalb_Chr04g0251371 [Lupinus albus]|uniref:Chromatin target of PRMT1 protein n=1 Tax=Lupinus albus TaxID=3870 RepID=A0A6A4QNJ3_LUPAL|nr:hypothetical protein Lalb_Chr04g0251371 [Lupinus albus]
MASSLDMSLDDRVRNRSNRGRGRGRGRDRPGRGQGMIPGGGRKTGPVRRGPLTVNVRPSSHAIAKASSKNVDAYTCA